MPSYKATALVLKKTKLGETDLIITFLDEEGLQRRAVAKGARKPGSFMAARLELYTVVEVQLSTGRSLDIVTDARIVVSHSACRASLEQSAACAVVVELIEKATTHHNAEPLLYAMALAALECIGKAEGTAPAMISLACTLKIFAALGVRPDTLELAYSEEFLTKWIDILLSARFADLLVHSSKEYLPILCRLAEFCTQWAQDHLDLKLKSLGFLRSLL
ncbi:MAG: DNA repair protein RecO [Coriobacteriia bacterium]|nr:DNA repair protein RecO [Coriobacteriia bacterium]